MKLTPFFSSLGICAALHLGVANAQDAAPAPEAPAVATGELHPAIAELTQEQRDQLSTHLKAASEYVQGVRITECIEECQKAVAIAPDFYPPHNLMGAAYTKIRDFEKARAAFVKANELEPRAFDVRFNLAEMDFVEAKFGDAQTAIKKLIDENPRLPEATYDLLVYKIVICELKNGNLTQAKALADKEFSYIDDSAAYYYTQAAIAFAEEDRPTAFSWIRSAGGIFDASQNQNYLDSLIEVGWVESLGSGVAPGQAEGSTGEIGAPPSEVTN